MFVLNALSRPIITLTIINVIVFSISIQVKMIVRVLSVLVLVMLLNVLVELMGLYSHDLLFVLFYYFFCMHGYFYQLIFYL